MSSPSHALHPLSPRRMNQQAFHHSPSLPTDLLGIQQKSPNRGSDVQSRVAFLNNLSRGGDSPSSVPHSSSGGHSAALQRAVLGREEAESALSNANAQLSEAQSRERRISERLESLLEELQTNRERQAHERVVFEKEIKKARKEAFRAGSTVVKLQEELKHSRTEIKALKDEVAAERDAKENAKQEAFERDYALASITEELEVLKGRLRSVEASNRSNSLEAKARQIHKESLGRMSLAEGDLDFLITPRKSKRSADDSENSDDRDTPKQSSSETPQKKQRLSDFTPKDREDIPTHESLLERIEDLEIELFDEKAERADCEAFIEFMKMECQFKACSCRLAEARGEEYIYDVEYDRKLKAEAAAEAEKAKQLEEAEQAEQGKQSEQSSVPTVNNARPPPRHASPPPPQPTQDANVPVKEENGTEAAQDHVIAFSPATGTFKTIPSPARDAMTDHDGEPMVISEQVEPQVQSIDESISRSPLAVTEAKVRHHSPQINPASVLTPSFPSKSASSAPDDSNMRITPDLPRDPLAEITNTNEYSTTKTIPLRTESSPTHQFGTIPGTPINREQALAQIRARRGRAQSTKRSVSANEATVRSARFGATPNREARRIPGFHQKTGTKSEGDASERRDMSAPVRFRR